MVDAAEVGDDDGHGQRDDEHAAEGADAAHQLPHGRAGHHVSVPAGRERIHMLRNGLIHLKHSFQTFYKLFWRSKRAVAFTEESGQDRSLQ